MRYPLAENDLQHRRSFNRQLCWDKELPADLVQQLWGDPLSLLRSGHLLQEKARCVVVRLDHSAGRFVLKHHNWGRFTRAIKNTLRRSSAEKAFFDTRFLHAAGVRTPRAWAFGQQKIGPLNGTSFLLTEYIEGTTLYRHMRFDRPSEEKVHDLAKQVAEFWQQLDDLKVSHNDFKTENFQIDPDGKLWLIDLERVRRCRTPAKLRGKQVQDAEVFLHPRNWRAQPAAAETFRRQILQTPAAIAATSSQSAANHPLRRPTCPENRPSQLLTVLIPCHGPIGNLKRCIESVRDIADEILVVYPATIDTLCSITPHVEYKPIGRDDLDELALEKWAQSQARHPWILRIVPNERLNSELGKQVQDCLAAEPEQDGFRIQRRCFHGGRALRFGGFRNDAPVRLFRRDIGQLEIRAGQIEVAVAPKKTGDLLGKLMCDMDSNLEQQISQLNRLTTSSAQLTAQRQLDVRSRTYRFAALVSFLRSYILQMGFLDGQIGLNAAWQLAFATWLHHAKRHEFRQGMVEVESESQRTLKLFVPGKNQQLESTSRSLAKPVVAEMQQTRAAA
jgi:(heptosyl)LPS beta-1,4-glucosyltransferase